MPSGRYDETRSSSAVPDLLRPGRRCSTRPHRWALLVRDRARPTSSRTRRARRWSPTSPGAPRNASGAGTVPVLLVGGHHRVWPGRTSTTRRPGCLTRATTLRDPQRLPDGVRVPERARAGCEPHQVDPQARRCRRRRDDVEPDVPGEPGRRRLGGRWCGDDLHGSMQPRGRRSRESLPSPVLAEPPTPAGAVVRSTLTIGGTAMHTRTLGQGLEVSAVGLGAHGHVA